MDLNDNIAGEFFDIVVQEFAHDPLDCHRQKILFCTTAQHWK